MCMCGCVCLLFVFVCECVRACVRPCVRACVRMRQRCLDFPFPSSHFQVQFESYSVLFLNKYTLAPLSKRQQAVVQRTTAMGQLVTAQYYGNIVGTTDTTKQHQTDKLKAQTSDCFCIPAPLVLLTSTASSGLLSATPY